jgi:Icc protein
VYNNWCLIMLNSTIRWDDGGRLEKSQLEFLQRTLNEQRGKFAFIAMHHHPLPMGSQWLDGLNLRNSDEFFNIIDQYPNVKVVVWGHVHQASQRDRNGVTMLSSPSTGSQFLPESDVFMMDARPPGYRWINLMPDGSVDTEVVWLS